MTPTYVSSCHGAKMTRCTAIGHDFASGMVCNECNRHCTPVEAKREVFTAHLSKCCDAGMKVVGGDYEEGEQGSTYHYKCLVCGKACDARPFKTVEAKKKEKVKELTDENRVRVIAEAVTLANEDQKKLMREAHLHCQEGPTFHRCYLCCGKIGSFRCNTPNAPRPDESKVEIEEHWVAGKLIKRTFNGKELPNRRMNQIVDPREVICEHSVPACDKCKTGSPQNNGGICGVSPDKTRFPSSPTEGWKKIVSEWKKEPGRVDFASVDILLGRLLSFHKRKLIDSRVTGIDLGESISKTELAKKDEEIKQAREEGKNDVSKVYEAMDSRREEIRASYRAELREKIRKMRSLHGAIFIEDLISLLDQEDKPNPPRE